MSRTVRSSQPPGGQSSISLSWHDHHRSHHEPKLSSRKTQPTPRRCHDTASASCYREPKNGGGSLSARARNSSSQLDRSYRKDDHDSQRVSSHQQRPGRQSRHHSAHDEFFQSRSNQQIRRTASAGREDTSGSRHSARTHRKSEHAPVSSRSLPQFGAVGSTSDRRYSRQVPAGKGTRSRFSESEWQAAVHIGRHSENRMSRTLPGEELPSPIQDPWMETHERNDDAYMPSSSRSRNQQCTLLYSRAKQNDQLDYPREDYSRQDDHIERSVRCSAQRSSGHFRGQDTKSTKQSSYDRSSLKSHKKPVPGRCPQPWSMGSSATTSAQGSVIDSSVTDLWDTCSVDSLPLGAEWFNFMHAH
jgi:hypothetical protein